MRVRGCGPAAVGAGLCFAMLAACGGSADRDPPPRAPRVSPTATGESPPTTATGGPAVNGKVIVIDPGHNGGNADHTEQINKKVFVGNGYKACNTVGTNTRDGYSEHAFAWDVANRLARVLREWGAKVTLTRKDDTGVGPCVTERAAIGNRLHADAAVSIHADGAEPSGHGFHVIEPVAVGKNASIVEPSRKLGTAVRDAYRSGTGIPYSTYRGRDGLDRRSDLGGLNLSTVPVVFIECGNMQNPGDAATLSSAPSRQRMAESLAAGLESYLR
ncbi:N-acetylmuramoyl-L-alanine amidase [Actinomadura sp. KC216]|uniref:N-acetylmuramoyl-L-alanine amidase n=1 Tax=Actinomadura sp. KC216 TaxID=2530370 RepID=UPI001FB66C69|nr:N-acetylmuramoyl-L-alanine amidase [Actinomadura sp. KC216]